MLTRFKFLKQGRMAYYSTTYLSKAYPLQMMFAYFKPKLKPKHSLIKLHKVFHLKFLHLHSLSFVLLFSNGHFRSIPSFHALLRRNAINTIKGLVTAIGSLENVIEFGTLLITGCFISSAC